MDRLPEGKLDIAKAIGLAGLSFAFVTTIALLADPLAAGLAYRKSDRLSALFAGLASPSPPSVPDLRGSASAGFTRGP